ncbi:MAG: Crp/Fnr family transcriptional regulator [Bacteroidetes bacterium]|nr:MAG: Crp/Fnr family transcriptional regulator [Bacteroidota bacterium]
MEKLLRENYSHFFEEDLIQEILNQGLARTVKQGEILLDYQQQLLHVPLLLEGALKIMRLDEQGDELLLYYLESGDTCSMTLTCCLRTAKSEIRAVAEQDSKLFLIPVTNMAHWMQRYSGWMQFVFESYHRRTNELLEAIDSLAFKNMHDRLRNYLREKAIANKSTVLESTHQEIANDLHSSRVVISRLLKNLEELNEINIARNKIEILQL